LADVDPALGLLLHHAQAIRLSAIVIGLEVEDVRALYLAHIGSLARVTWQLPCSWFQAGPSARARRGRRAPATTSGAAAFFLRAARIARPQAGNPSPRWWPLRPT